MIINFMQYKRATRKINVAGIVWIEDLISLASLIASCSRDNKSIKDISWRLNGN